MVHRLSGETLRGFWGETMSGRTISNLSGKKFGSLTAIERVETPPGAHNAYWLCRCDCGKHLIVRSDNLVTGHTQRCRECGTTRRTGSVFVEVEENEI